MRQMTPGEKDKWCNEGVWPCCGGNTYMPGPRGGCSMNITCPNCGMKMNVYDPESGVPVPMGQVLWAPPGYKPPPDPPKPTRWQRFLQWVGLAPYRVPVQ